MCVCTCDVCDASVSGGENVSFFLLLAFIHAYLRLFTTCSLFFFPSGDAVLVSPTMTTLNILPSDDPNGVFQFTAASRDISAEEGDTLQMT